MMEASAVYWPADANAPPSRNHLDYGAWAILNRFSGNNDGKDVRQTAHLVHSLVCNNGRFCQNWSVGGAPRNDSYVPLQVIWDDNASSKSKRFDAANFQKAFETELGHRDGAR